VKVDLAELLDANDVARVLGLSHRQAVSTYRARYPNFPEPVVIKGACMLWRRSDVKQWQGRRNVVPPDGIRPYLFGHVHRLIWAVRLQARRVIPERFDAPSPEELADIEADAYLFVYALRDLRLAALAARPWGRGRIDAAVRAFDAAVPDVKHMRDVLAHFDDYELGTGTLQKQGRAGEPIRMLNRGTGHATIWVLPFKVEVHTGRDAAEGLAGEAFEVLHTDEPGR
jgi:predicted DNA-binding transcriptional regulator AlpA